MSKKICQQYLFLLHCSLIIMLIIIIKSYALLLFLNPPCAMSRSSPFPGTVSWWSSPIPCGICRLKLWVDIYQYHPVILCLSISTESLLRSSSTALLPYSDSSCRSSISTGGLIIWHMFHSPWEVIMLKQEIFYSCHPLAVTWSILRFWDEHTCEMNCICIQLIHG